MPNKTPPAIRREYCEDDRDVDVIATTYDTVSFQRGFGDVGYKLQVVEHDCSSCSHDRMFRNLDVSPEHPGTVRYWCLSPACPHYVSDRFRYAQAHCATKPTETGRSADV